MTLFTSDIYSRANDRQVTKTIITYLAVTAFCIVFDRIYALFGHGVFSASMSFMFLCPLLGGVLPFLLLKIFIYYPTQVSQYRVLYNAYNSGIAALTVGSLLNGIFEIAGTSSSYLIFFNAFGWLAIAMGVTTYVLNVHQRNCSRKAHRRARFSHH